MGRSLLGLLLYFEHLSLHDLLVLNGTFLSVLVLELVGLHELNVASLNLSSILRHGDFVYMKISYVVLITLKLILADALDATLSLFNCLKVTLLFART